MLLTRLTRKMRGVLPAEGHMHRNCVLHTARKCHSCDVSLVNGVLVTPNMDIVSNIQLASHWGMCVVFMWLIHVNDKGPHYAL